MTPPDDPEHVAGAMIAAWSAAFTRLDAPALAALYSEHALFYGSKATLFRGRDGVAAYFNGLPRWRTPGVAFSEIATTAAGDSVVNMAGRATFHLDDGASLAVKITWVMVREPDGWRIVSHHVSPVAPLIAQT